MNDCAVLILTEPVPAKLIFFVAAAVMLISALFVVILIELFSSAANVPELAILFDYVIRRPVVLEPMRKET